MRFRSGILATVLILILLGFQTVLPLRAAQSDSDKIAQIDTYLGNLTKSNLFSGSVLIAYNGSVLLDKGYGIANRDWNIPNAPDTKFRIASLTKQFTAMSILMLQEQGKLSIGDHVCQYIDNCPTTWANITIHNLLNHTDGIPDVFSVPDAEAIQGQTTGPNELIAKFSQLPLDFPPGTSWEYGNSGFDVLGQVIAKVSKEVYSKYLQDHILTPLGMTDTVYDFSNTIVPHRATGYSSSVTTADIMDTSFLYSAAGLYSTVDDLYKWDQGLYNWKVVSKQTWDAMLASALPTPASQGYPRGEAYAYGLFVGKTGSHPEIGHPGGVSGFASSIEHLQDVNFTVIVLSNFDMVDADALSNKIVQMFFGS